MSMEKMTLVHIRDVPNKKYFAYVYSISYSETRFPFITPTKRRHFPLESWSQSGIRTAKD